MILTIGQAKRRARQSYRNHKMNYVFSPKNTERNKRTLIIDWRSNTLKTKRNTTRNNSNVFTPTLSATIRQQESLRTTIKKSIKKDKNSP